MLSYHLNEKNFYRRHVRFKYTNFFVLSEENKNGDTDAEWKYTYLVLPFLSLRYITQQGKRTKFSVQYFWRAPHRQERDLEKKYIIFVWSKTPTLRRYLSIPFNDIRKQSVKLRRTVSVVAKKLHHFFKKVEWFRIKLVWFQIIPNPRVEKFNHSGEFTTSTSSFLCVKWGTNNIYI